MNIKLIKKICMAVVTISLLIAGTAQANNSTPSKVGENIRLPKPIVLEYANSEGSEVISHPGADYIKVHFSKLDLEEGDYVTVTDGKGTEVFRYPNDLPSGVVPDEGFWSFSIMGDSAVITLQGTLGQPAAADTIDNVVIDKYGYGDFSSAVVLENAESICGSRDWRNVACYSGTTEYNNSSATARLIFQRGGSHYTCTAWRVGPSPNNNLVITNQHCIRNQQTANTAELWFNYQYNNCNGNGRAAANRVIVRVNRLLEVNAQNDIALLSINNPSKVSSFGYYELDNRVPVQGEEIYIPQHPGGIPKVLAINSGNGKCVIGGVNAQGNRDIHYRCDTEGGSSGSPVIARSSNKVIGLHHLGGNCRNTAVKTRRFFDLVKPHLSNGSNPPTQPPSGNSHRIQAESGSLSGEARTYRDSAASGGQGVAYLTSGSSITWNNVPASKRLKVTYASQNSGQISIYVNGRSVGDLSFNGNNTWTGNYSTASARVNIPQGASVALRNDSGDSALNVDFVDFIRKNQRSDSGNQACTGDDIPAATVTHTNETSNGANDGTITFNFRDNTSNGNARTNIAFSIDGGSTYPHSVSDDSGSTTVRNLAPGNYNLWVRWGNGQCPRDLPDVSIQAGVSDDNNSSTTTPSAPSEDLVFGIESDGTLYHVNGGQSASWAYLCQNGDCRAATLVGNRWERKSNLTSGTHNIEFKVQDNAKGQCLFTANNVEVGSGVTHSNCQ